MGRFHCVKDFGVNNLVIELENYSSLIMEMSDGFCDYGHHVCWIYFASVYITKQRRVKLFLLSKGYEDTPSTLGVKPPSIFVISYPSKQRPEQWQ